MFVYSVKATALRFAAVLIACIAVMAIFLALVPAYDPGAEADPAADMAGDAAALLEYIEGHGWRVSGTPEQAEFRIPDAADEDTGADADKTGDAELNEYAGQAAVRYTYEITGGENGGKMYLDLVTVGEKIVSGDIRTAEGEVIIGLDGR